MTAWPNWHAALCRSGRSGPKFFRVKIFLDAHRGPRENFSRTCSPIIATIFARPVLTLHQLRLEAGTTPFLFWPMVGPMLAHIGPLHRPAHLCTLRLSLASLCALPFTTFGLVSPTVLVDEVLRLLTMRGRERTVVKFSHGRLHKKVWRLGYTLSMMARTRIAAGAT